MSDVMPTNTPEEAYQAACDDHFRSCSGAWDDYCCDRIGVIDYVRRVASARRELRRAIDAAALQRIETTDRDA